MANHKQQMRIALEGFVQGVGLRPFVARLAGLHRQQGWVANTLQGVEIALEGDAAGQQAFLADLRAQAPSAAAIMACRVSHRPAEGCQGFVVKASRGDGGQASAFVLPDIATCPACVGELFDAGSRFFRYPFISCCQCGPRYSIMRAQPYDRGHTSMAAFPPCRSCRQDYLDPGNRRYHAQTIACPECGPQLSLLDAEGRPLAGPGRALVEAASLLGAGQIVAVKGVGGFQLLADAGNQAALLRLRQRKRRPEQPFALMVGGLDAARRLVRVNAAAAAALCSAAAPIVLLPRRGGGGPLAQAVAPGLNWLGVMLPCSPLQHLLLAEFGAPLVATSGNLHQEPLCHTLAQALARLGGVADCFLSHDLEILRPLDDSVLRIINGAACVLRRGRGLAPRPVRLPATPPPSLAAGGHLKNTIALNIGDQAIVSGHLGDLDAADARRRWQEALVDLPAFYRQRPGRILVDRHPDHPANLCALPSAPTVVPVQHHYAHALACMAEHGLLPPVLAVCWDGLGLGDDNQWWGGECLLISRDGYERLAHLWPFPLPGGGKAAKEPRRAALGALYECYRGQAGRQVKLPFTEAELALLLAALDNRINSPATTSVGRLFDAIACVLGLCAVNSYEGQAAMALESCAVRANSAYPFAIAGRRPLLLDWRPMLRALLAEAPGKPAGVLAGKFHLTLAELLAQVAARAGQPRVVLSGGCFQNALLTEAVASRLSAAGFAVYCHRDIPANDGGLALGQLYAAHFL